MPPPRPRHPRCGAPAAAFWPGRGPRRGEPRCPGSGRSPPRRLPAAAPTRACRRACRSARSVPGCRPGRHCARSAYRRGSFRLRAATSSKRGAAQGRHHQFARQGSSRRSSETAHPQPEVSRTPYSGRSGQHRRHGPMIACVLSHQGGLSAPALSFACCVLELHAAPPVGQALLHHALCEGLSPGLELRFGQRCFPTG